MQIVTVAIGLVWHQGCVLVGRRPMGTDFAGYDEWPGGKCLPGETPQDAVVRECREEAGLLVAVRGQRAIIPIDNPKGPRELHFFDCEWLEPTTEVVQPPFEWWTVEQCRQGRFPPANQSIIDQWER